MKKHVLLLAAVLFSSVVFISCDKDDDDDNTVSSSNTMTGSQEVPANSSTATGTVNVTFNKDTKSLTYTATWSGLSGAATAMHFHAPAVAGVNASVLVGVTGFTAAASGTVSGTVNVASTTLATAEADLLAGKWYFNIHTANYPGGEIRGQITF